MGRRSALIRMGALVFLISVLCPAVSLRNLRVWDDQWLLNERLRPERASNPLQFWAEPYGSLRSPDFYRPVGLTLLYAEHRLSGDWTPVYRAVSLVLHGFASLAFFAFLLTIVPAPVAFVAAVLFAAHPVHAEAVSMAYGQLEILMALFSFLSLRFFAREKFAASLGFAALAMLSKESGLMLPAVVVLLNALYLNPSKGGAASSKAHKPPWHSGTTERELDGPGADANLSCASSPRTGLRRWLPPRVLWFAPVAAAAVAVRYAVLGAMMQAPEETITFGYPISWRLRTIVVSLGNDIRLALFPTAQSLYYGHLREHLANGAWTELAWIFAGAVLVWIVAGEIGWKPTLFCAGWFLLAVFPVLNLVPSAVLVAERNLYLPVAGVVLAAALVAQPHLARRAAWVGFAALLLVCVADVNHVAARWRDNETLWRSTIAAYPTSPLAYSMLGAALMDPPGRESEAEDDFRHALGLNPLVQGAKRGLGIAAMRRGDYRSALALLEQARAEDPAVSVDAEISQCRLRL